MLGCLAHTLRIERRSSSCTLHEKHLKQLRRSWCTKCVTAAHIKNTVHILKMKHALAGKTFHQEFKHANTFQLQTKGFSSFCCRRQQWDAAVQSGYNSATRKFLSYKLTLHSNVWESQSLSNKGWKKKCISKKQAYNYSYFLRGLIFGDTPTSPLCSKGCSETYQVLCSVSLQLTLISVAPILTIFLSIFSDQVWVCLRFLPSPLPPTLHPTFPRLTDRFLWQGYKNSLGVHV